MIGILTFYWADDYGAMLQAYGLKRRLEQLGEQVEIIPYAPVKLTGRYWLCPVCAASRNGGIRYRFNPYMFAENLLLGGGWWRRRRCMRAFRRRYLTEKPPFHDVGKISLLDCKTVFVGSDQVWNPEITAGLDDAYIGNIPHRGDCRLAAYGASMGGGVFSEGDQRKFVEHVGGGFSAISLREQTDAARVEQLLGRKVCDVLDPVLLLDRPEWERLGNPPAETDYILLYLTQFNGPLMRCARALAAQTGKRIISLTKPHVLMEHRWDTASIRGIEIRIDGGPAEFLGYLQNAWCVLTNSFHGTAFSVLLEKRFLSFRHRTKNVRLEDLLRKLGLASHMTQTEQPGEAAEIWAHTDWEAVRARLEEERKKSERFILENI